MPGPAQQRPDSESLQPHRRWGWRVLGISVFVLGLVFGILNYHRIVVGVTSMIPAASPRGKILYWTSPHDPNFKSDQRGVDAMGMDLVPVYEGQRDNRRSITIDPVLQEDQVRIGIVEDGALVRTVHAIGTVNYAEPLIGDITLKVNAWIEKLFVDYVGQPVRKGDPLLEIYSPELVATEQDFLIMLQSAVGPSAQAGSDTRRADDRNLESVRERLRNWNLTDEQINELAATRRVPTTTTFYSPFDGVVTEKMAFEGRYMAAGAMLYRIADLSKVWVYLYVYQDEMHCVYVNQGATMTLANLPGHVIHGKVVYIYPYLEPTIRAVKVRLEFENSDLLLKPGMFAQVVFEPHRMGTGLMIPRQAVLETGTRQLVYVSLPDNKYRAQEVTTGMDLDGEKVELLSGLSAGEHVVTSSQFLIDSESRLRLVNRKFVEPDIVLGDVEHAPQSAHGMEMPSGDDSPAANRRREQISEQMPGHSMSDMKLPNSVKD